MIKSVHIAGYKSLSDVFVELPESAVLIGPHSAGKSNFFDALGLLASFVTSRTLREAFENHRGAPWESFDYAHRLARNSSKGALVRLTLEADVVLSDAAIETVENRIRQMREGMAKSKASNPRPRNRIREKRLRYLLSLEMAPSSRMLRVADERLTALNSDGSESQRRLPFIERVKDKLRLRVDSQAHPTDFEVGLDFALVSQPLFTPYYAHIAAFKEELSRWCFYRLEPEAIRRPTAYFESPKLGRDGSGLDSWLRTLVARDRGALPALCRSLKVVLPEIDSIELDASEGPLSSIRVIERGVPVSMPLLSDGALRILGLLATTNPATHATLIAFEEPENGVQAECLSPLAKLFQAARTFGTQVLINTHSPNFANCFEDSQLLVCRRREMGSEFSGFRSSGPLMRLRELESALTDPGK